MGVNSPVLKVQGPDGWKILMKGVILRGSDIQGATGDTSHIGFTSWGFVLGFPSSVWKQWI